MIMFIPQVFRERRSYHADYSTQGQTLGGFFARIEIQWDCLYTGFYLLPPPYKPSLIVSRQLETPGSFMNKEQGDETLWYMRTVSRGSGQKCSSANISGCSYQTNRGTALTSLDLVL